VRKKNTDVLPGVNLVYSPRSDMNVRAAWSKSVSRPEFRELSPVIFPEPRTFRSLVGNPDIVESHIKNYDLRWEWFFSSGQLVSFGLFYKTLSKPIEIGVAPIGSDLIDRFRNAEDGELKGFEFEGRKNFGFVSPRLNYVNFQTNVAYIQSNVKVPIEGTDQQTSTERELQGQSPFVVNAAIEYAHPEWGTARLLYNTAGRRIVSAGASGLPDFFEERRDQLDAVFVLPLKPLLGWPITGKLSVENILNTPTEVTLGGNTQRRFLTGTKFSIGFSYSY
jgi:outer membrane receptor protein involved in Fe transport